MNPVKFVTIVVVISFRIFGAEPNLKVEVQENQVRACVATKQSAKSIKIAKIVKAEEKRGCCSWHGGVCGCSGGRAMCCDGTLSPSCGCE